MNPQAKYYLRNLENLGGFYPWMAQIDSGMLFGLPFKATNNMPRVMTATALTGGAFQSIILADFAQVIIGQGDMRIMISEEASYTDGSTTRSLAQRNEIGIFVNYSTDMICRYDKAVAVLNSVTYGN